MKSSGNLKTPRLKQNCRLSQPVRLGWKSYRRYYARTVVGTDRAAGPDCVYFTFAGDGSFSSKEECLLRSAAEGIPLLDITGLDGRKKFGESRAVVKFVVRHNPGAAEES